MPSMHVSMAMLFALSISKISRAAAVGAWIFMGTIFVASVHLAYHYAVDGYVAIVATLAIWAVAKPLARMVAKGCEGSFGGSSGGVVRPVTT